MSQNTNRNAEVTSDDKREGAAKENESGVETVEEGNCEL